MSFSLSYPHAELTACIDKPTPEGICITVAELCANAGSIFSTLGGGDHGHQGAVLSNTTYATLAGVNNAHVLPKPPVPPTPATIAAALANNQHMTPAVQLALYDMERTTYKTAIRVETDMRRQLIAAYPPTYLAVLAATKDGAIGSCSVKEIIAHLQATYATVRVSDVNRELNKLNDSFIPNRPIEEYWSKINGVVAFTNKHAPPPPTDVAVITAILKSFERDGHFPTECKAWRLLPNARYILVTFIKEITDVHELSGITAGKAGYHGANMAICAPTAEPASRANAAAIAPVTPVRAAANKKAAPPGTRTHNAETGRTYNVCYCSVHGMQNAKKNGAHANKECPDGATNTNWKDGATLMERLGGSDKIACGRQAAASK
jgi:hypothetical protein